ncbi:hypothetical protein SAMD00019534_027910 [Acytostelium subglobosum LB1]|uniref:hypothetical protein n=1 Tax=Acytostelium subglobosum LB1 TaxID=1410327 RepID=UPI000644B703|nr:hypothetical protein SAMD00019534_027910 [Acytostelium subglobosum LB1]GAM19616.1 hypothetical protein SAMD00019534_027910 [Acytostelium subglobosum LB1]|eukprot:XP_012756378.1 hypothetical protein SAMD00019534_027910 [Acytostelium subglobosum LB1]
MNNIGKIARCATQQLGARSFTTSATPYVLPDLPYDFGALEPVISGDIMKLHHQMHHKAYVTNFNASLEKYQACEAAKDIAGMIALQPALRFNGGGHINHSIFWTNLAPKNQQGGVAPTGPLAEAINKQWGSLEKFIETFSAQTVAIQGSGWGWLGYCHTTGRLVTQTCANQDPLLGVTPLLGIDVWEHAYYLQYKNVRAAYVKGIWEIVNWSNVAERYKKASSK